MKGFKKILLIIIGVIVLLALFGVWYTMRYSMETVQPYQVNAPDMPKKLLIATQGSEYKNQLTKGIVDHYKMDSVFINVIDVSGLEAINAHQYNAITIIHTWEKWSAPEPVITFISKNKNMRDKILVMITTGGSGATLAHVDAIVGESELGNLPKVEVQMIEFLDTLLKP